MLKTKEAVIRSKLVADADLSAMLGSYGGVPAVFLQQAPMDTDDGWDKEKQYPRIEFNLSKFYSPDIEQSGTLSIDVICSQDSNTPEEIEPLVKASIADVFFFPEVNNAFCLRWKSTEGFSEENGKRLYYGATLIFDVLEFPSMFVGEPCPVSAMTNFLHQLDSNITLLGCPHAEDYIYASKERPAMWVQLISTKTNRQTYTCTWVDAVLSIHIFCKRKVDRQMWMEQVVREIEYRGEVIMLDGSPMLTENVQADYGADELTGQIRVNCEYGKLKRVTQQDNATFDKHFERWKF